MSPRRWGVNTRMWAYRYLVIRDGEQCARCFEIPTTQNALDIDHIDGQPHNNDPNNLRLLCRSCNVAMANKDRSGPSDKYVCERERGEGKASTRVVREVVSYSQGSPEMQANFLYELDFRKWCLGIVLEKGFITKQDAVAAGAEVVGCSPSTTARYLVKLISSVGPLLETRDLLREPCLVLRDHLTPEATIQVDLDRWQARQGQARSEKTESEHPGQCSLELET